MHKSTMLFALAAFVFIASRGAAAAPLQPAAHGDFKYYTFALTWQPGFCTTGTPCLPDQPKAPVIGLHGLWASLPTSLAATGATTQEWWDRGCDFYAHSDAAPVLEPAVQAKLDAVMPHLEHSLLTHEYDKHVQCFAFDPGTFFSTELTMRDAVVSSPFGRDLIARTGGEASHAAVVASFEAAFGTTNGASLQLRCTQDAARGPQLAQLWITIDAAKVDAFPAAASLIDAPIAQDDCPEAFHMPAWPDPDDSASAQPR